MVSYDMRGMKGSGIIKVISNTTDFMTCSYCAYCEFPEDPYYGMPHALCKNQDSRYKDRIEEKPTWIGPKQRALGCSEFDPTPECCAITEEQARIMLRKIPDNSQFRVFLESMYPEIEQKSHITSEELAHMHIGGHRIISYFARVPEETDTLKSSL